MRIRFTRHAAADLHDAGDHYTSIAPALREQFLADVDLVMERIHTFPHGAAP
ncbi:type II toxin-antitoxin system RelE/ParE family toxin [Janibacter corallicola]|uniref:type II toxin-antitoxin system RelE/ParE family toxin n=1 Tax=Janibacter corallicola TaxID=415212 RepID=UPI000AE6E284|nr:type II toxin-antitoxin system RelE/ParE family toxin [Janibacter corallicola]